MTLDVKNDGQIAHALEVEGPNGEAKTGTIDPGSSATLTVDLSKPGTYEMYCPIDNHKGMGMKGTVVVAGGGSGAVQEDSRLRGQLERPEQLGRLERLLTRGAGRAHVRGVPPQVRSRRSAGWAVFHRPGGPCRMNKAVPARNPPCRSLSCRSRLSGSPTRARRSESSLTPIRSRVTHSLAPGSRARWAGR